MKVWLFHHWRALRSTFARFARAPFATIFNVLVIGVALALPLALYTLLFNVQSWARHFPADPQITLFLSRDASSADVAAIRQRLAQDADVRTAIYVPRDQALAEMKRSTGLADVLDGLDANPLPDAFVIQAKDPAAAVLERMRGEFVRWPKVDQVQLDSVWARRLEAIVRAASVAVFVLATLLAFALVAVTFNTIRLQILTRQADIELARLFGATNAFIRRPFLYDGAVLGATGGIAGCAVVAATLALLNRELAPLSALYGTFVALRPVGWQDLLTVLTFAGALGWLGAWLSVSRHLASR